MRAVAVATAMLLGPATPMAAQDFGRAVSPILTLDQDQLFAGTLYGQRVNRELESATTAMAAETQKIQAALEAEELALTEQRATMEPEAFRALATAFDDKVQALRAEREATEDDLVAQIEAARSTFFSRIRPVLGDLVRDRGAMLIVDRRAVILAATNVDITADAIERIDAVLGDGGDLSVDETPAVTAPDATVTNGEAPGGVDTIPAPVIPTDDAPDTPEN